MSNNDNTVWPSVNEFLLDDIDYFNEDESFDGSSGVGVGTASEMAAITGTKQFVGFWVTDEGDWNTDGTDGRLYIWDGNSWEQYYEPYTYPHPLRHDVNLPVYGSVTASGNATVTGTVTIGN